MALIPHAGELALIFGVILLIFGLGRLPQISYALAGAGKFAKGKPDQPAPASEQTDATEDEEEDSPSA